MSAGLRAPLANSRFASLWAATLVSSIGSSIHSIAVIWLAYEVSGDPVLVSVVAVAALVPDLVLSIPAGTLVDRWNRIRVMIAADLVRSGAVAAIPVVAVAGPGEWLVPVVVAAAVLEGAMAAFVTPTRSAVIPRLVDDTQLDAANSLLALTTSAARTSYVLGGALIAVIGTTGAFALNAVSFLVAAVFLARVPVQAGIPRRSETGSTRPSRLRRETVDGVRFIVRTPIVRSIVALSMAAGLAMGPIAIVLPFFLEAELNGGSAAFGFVYGAVFVGTIVGSIVVGTSPALVTRYRGPFMIGGLALSGLALIGTARLTGGPLSIGVAAACMAVFGAGIAAIQVPGRTLMHTVVPDDYRGRVFAVVKTLALASPPVAIVAAGPLVERLGAGTVLVLEGGLIVATAIALCFSSLARVYGDEDPVAQPADRDRTVSLSETAPTTVETDGNGSYDR